MGELWVLKLAVGYLFDIFGMFCFVSCACTWALEIIDETEANYFAV
jgi:hypothetical protein